MEVQRKESSGSKKKVKVVFLGDKGVGKSSIIHKFALNKFDQHSQATIGVDYMTKSCRYNSSKYKLELWDTAGQEKYRSLIKGYLRGANACVFVYDQSNPSTYTNLVDWIKTFEEVSQEEQTQVIIFGNKTDLVGQKEQLFQVKRDTIRAFPKLCQIAEIEGSAKEGFNIYQIFEQILQQFEKKNAANPLTSTKTIGQTLIKTFKGNKGETLTCCYI